MKNNFPEKEIAFLEFETVKNKSKWIVAGITLADNNPELFKTDLSFGIPNTWAAGAVAFALIEGLGGVKDAGIAYDRVKLSPRWTASNEKTVNMTAKYEASGRYVSYKFANEQDSINFEFTGNAAVTELELLLPEGKKALAFSVNGAEKPILIKSVEKSEYVVTTLTGVGVYKIEVKLG